MTHRYVVLDCYLRPLIQGGPLPWAVVSGDGLGDVVAKFACRVDAEKYAERLYEEQRPLITEPDRVAAALAERDREDAAGDAEMEARRKP